MTFFTDKVAVVTGAGGGIGQAISRRLMREGALVVGADINRDAVDAVAERLRAEGHPGRFAATQTDVSSHDEQEALADYALETFGSLSFWVNNAGITEIVPFAEVDRQMQERVFSINVNSVVYGTLAAARAMGDSGGAIINLSSVSAFVVRPGFSTYAASKAAVDHYTKFQAVELGRSGIRVNAIAPGMINTAMSAWAIENPAEREKALEIFPLGRFGEPEDIANAAAFLLSDEASFITGTTLFVDGGSRNR